MKIIKKFISGVVLLFAAIMLFSCNLEDFNLKKLANPNDIVPDIFAPVAYGTFKVSDFVPIPTLDDNFPIPNSSLSLDSVIISKVGTTFRSAAIDTVFLITHFTNSTLVDIEFNMSFIDKFSGNPPAKSFPSGKIAPGAIDQMIQFKLGPTDQNNLQNATDIKMSFKISSPATGSITYGAVKSKPFTIKIYFHVPVNLQKL